MAEPEQSLPEFTKLKIDGKLYDAPDDFTLGEARIIKRFTGKTLDEFSVIETTDPDAMAALIFIMLRREDPSVTEADVEAISLASIAPDDSAEEGEGEGDAGPPDAGSPETEETPPDSGAPA